MKVLSGAIQPDAGDMSLDGARYAPADPLDARRAGVAMIYQELSLAPHLTVAENILLGMEPARLGVRRSVARCASGPRARWRSCTTRASAPTPSVGTLPIAAQQIVEIGRAVAVGCRVLVLDEPTSSLAQADAEALFELVRAAAAAGPRDRLHHPLHRGGQARRRSLHRAARRRDRRRRRDGGDHRARDRRPDGRPPRRAALPAQRARARRAAAGGDGPGRRRQARARQLHASPRRGAGHRRPGRRGPHRAAARALRPGPGRVRPA